MSHHAKPTATLIGLLLNTCRVYCQSTRETSLIRASGSECQTEPLGDAWTSPSGLTCYWDCVTFYPTSCQSVVYNADTQTCTPGGVAFRPLEFISKLLPRAHSADTIYYTKQPIPSCDTGSGNFILFETCGFTACIHQSNTPKTYSQAVSDCDLIGARPLTIDTLPMYSVCRYATYPDHVWIGLTDRTQEGQYKWITGPLLSAEQDSYIWVPDQPNDAGGNEDCAEFIHVGLNDINCADWKKVICEPN
ncbi:C-type lectin domain family 4 member M [Elysia marginata]|uniref:C-type lectin domain family 4 member M n=1 Tax=Elysia marginata TaxID=1093978 RepID=A0AAV4JDP4_9GAST|nr:C-type lectin domain family 4 member M [Elysia marginata]